MDLGNLNLETLKSSLLFNFRTGNVMIDTFMTGMIICLSTYLMTLASRIQEIDWMDLLKKIFGPKIDPTPEPLINKITISGKKVESGYSQHYSDTFLALIYRIKKLNCVESDISELSEIRMDGQKEYDYDSSDDEEELAEEVLKRKEEKVTDLIVSQTTPFTVAENVEGVVNNHSTKKDDEEAKDPKNVAPPEEFHMITIYSSVLSMDELRKLLTSWTKEYRESIKLKTSDCLRYLVYSGEYSSEYQEFKFVSGKSFDNVFFPQKDDIIKRIDFFTNNKEWYMKRGIPHTFGFMFYGLPGCGKTSTIKAMANYTKRHIVSVPLSKVKSCKDLLDVFYKTRINGNYIPLHKRLYVLEDIDCDDLKHIVAERNKKSPSSDDDSDRSDDDGEKDNFLLQALMKNNKANAENGGKKGGFMNFFSSNLTLAGILEVLDGVMEMDGRMLVMTTNYPERLDSALIRPGRIDVKLNFGKCTTHCLGEMYEHFFEDPTNSQIWPENFDKTSLPNERWTPAEASQILLNNMDNPHQALDHFIKEFPLPVNVPKDDTISEPDSFTDDSILSHQCELNPSDKLNESSNITVDKQG